MKIAVLLIYLSCLPFALCEDAPLIKPGGEALAQAIISSNWTWENVAGGPKSIEGIQFYHSGFTQNSRFWTAKWEVVSPRMLVIENTWPGAIHFGEKAYLVFDAEFTHYVGFDFNGKTTVEGFRREALDPNRQPPEAKDQGTGFGELPTNRPQESAAVQKPANTGAFGADLAGSWHVENLADGTKATYGLNADHTFDRNGDRTGTWEVKNNQLTLYYTRGGFERHELSSSGSPLQGVNDFSQVLTLTRMNPNYFVGAWHVENLTDGTEATYLLNADNTFERNAHRTGTWEMKSNQLTLHYTGGGFERHELSASGAPLQGVNDFGQALTLIRMNAKAATASR